MFVSFYGDAQTVSVEDAAYFFLDVLSFSRRSVSDGKSVVPVESPDEWATTKQGCRDTYVGTCFLPSTIRILALFYVLSTVLRISSSNLFFYIYIFFLR